jgi:energy-converting hydrogenase Eha subunit G
VGTFNDILTVLSVPAIGTLAEVDFFANKNALSNLFLLDIYGLTMKIGKSG